MQPRPASSRDARRATLALSAVLLGLGAVPTARAEDPEESAGMVRLRQATSAYPDDPNLAWALAQALVETGHPEAETRLLDYEARWPGRQPQAGVHLGRILYESGRLEEALARLDRALALDSGQPIGHLYRGLVLRRLERFEAADRALAEVPRLAPGLGPNIARLRQRMRAQRQRALERREPEPPPDPAPRVARSSDDFKPAEVELPQSVERDERGAEQRSFRDDLAVSRGALRGFAATGYEWDSNPGRDHGVRSGGGDSRGIWETGLSFHPEIRENTSLAAGYRYRGSRHGDSRDEDRQRHETFLAGSWRISDRFAARAYTVAGYDQRDGRPRRWQFFARPSFGLRFGPRLGTGEFFGSFEYADFQNESSIDSLSQDGLGWSLGYRQRARVPGWKGAVATAGISFSSLHTDASRDANGFRDAYASRDLEGRIDFSLPLPAEFRARLSANAGRSWYPHRNAIDFLEGGRGRHRLDTWVGWRLALRRRLSSWIEIETSYRGVDTQSNVRAFDHIRHVIGLELGVVWNFGRLPWKSGDR